MLVDFKDIDEFAVPHLNWSEGQVCAKMAMMEGGKVMLARVAPGCSIGLHAHETSDDISLVVSGRGRAACDGAVEELRAGTCHICPKGSSHSIECTGDEGLVLFTVVPEQA